MDLIIKKMTQNVAVEALCWKYEKPYDVYNQVLTSSAILELLTLRYFAVMDHDTNQLVGYFCVGKPAQVASGAKLGLYEEECIDIGIGMKPELTGKGNGHHFFSCILRYVEEKFGEKELRLTVATFNRRAIHLYKKFGFLEQKKFEDNTKKYTIMKKSFKC